ncbi:MAG: MMPL family transporter [Pseudomonadota bacterium]
MIQRSAWMWVLLAFALSAAAGWYTVNNIGINTDTTDMISADLDWRGDFIEFREAFPILWRSLVVVIDGDSADLAEKAQRTLLLEIASREDLFALSDGESSEDYFARQGLLYQDTQQLQQLGDRLAQIQPFLGRLSRDPTLRGFAELFTLLNRAADQGSDLDAQPLMRELTSALDAASERRFHRFPWLELMDADGEVEASERRRVILLEPRLDSALVAPARPAIEFIYTLTKDLELDPDHGVEVRLTGPVALEYEELRSVSQGAAVAGMLALGMVLAVLLWGLRSATLVLASLITLLLGLVLTAAFAAFSVGRLNLISIAFAVLYIGLGIDFSVHYCLRYRELLREGVDGAQALRTASSDVGASLILCAVTTSIGFFAFYPTAFTGVSELGLISGTGMYISLLANLIVLPALLHVLPTPRPTADQPLGSSSGRAARGAWPQRHPRLVVSLAVALGAGAVAMLMLVRFDPNPLNLRDPDSPSVTAYRDLLGEPQTSPLILSVLASDLQAAQAVAERSDGLPLVQSARTRRNFVPSEQEERLALIEELGFIIGPDLTVADPQDLDQAQRLNALMTLGNALEELASDGDPGATQALAALERYRRGDPSGPALDTLERSLIEGFAPQLRRLTTALTASPVTLDSLPTTLSVRWRAVDGRERVELRPVENLADNAAMARFVDQVRGEHPRATGLPVVQLGAGAAVVQAFVQAIVTALILVSVLLLLLLRSPLATFQVMAPVLLASVFTAAATVLLGVDFNFANIIALPLLLGMGVDNGIHLVHRYRSAPPGDGNLLATSTARAVIFSALTTIVSFGNLATSAHPGTASMGLVLAVGLGLILLCTLLVLPAVLSLGSTTDEATP